MTDKKSDADKDKAPMMIRELQLRVKQLELEADNRVQLEDERVAHFEATVKSFASRSAGTAVAWATAQMIYVIMVALFDENAHTSAPPIKLKPHDELIARFCYASLCVLFCPAVLLLLSGKATRGFSFLADFGKLMQAFVPMILSWSLMDLFLALMKWLDNPGWDELIFVSVLIGLLAGLETLPCYVTAKAGVDAGGETDTLFNRYLTVPQYLALALGRLWNEFSTWPISELQSQVAGKPLHVFAIQLIYFLVLGTSIIALTAAWSKVSPRLNKQVAEDEGEHLKGYMEVHFVDIERTAGQLFVSTMSFVYAWGLSFTLQDFYFEVLWGCAPASSCGYPQHFLYALFISVAFTIYTGQLSYQDRTRAWGKAHQSLQVNAASLCVGWGWSGFFSRLIAQIQVEQGGSQVVSYIILFVALWFLGGAWWHSFLKDSRRRKHQRSEERKKTQVHMSELEGMNL